MLPLTVPFHPGQNFTSYFSGLACRNFAGNSRNFANELGLKWPDVVGGSDTVIKTMSDLGGIDLATLTAGTMRRVGLREFAVRQEVLGQYTLSRQRVIVCPCCLVDDIAVGRFGGLLDTYQRLAWEVTHIRACTRHDVRLVDLDLKLNHRQTFDFHLQIADQLDRINILAENTSMRPATKLEHYLTNRLAGHRAGLEWLDTLPFGLAAKVCEMLGVVLAFDSRRNLQTLPEDDWARAGDAGFAVCSGGVVSVRRCLEQLQHASPGKRSLHSRMRAFGQFYEWLAYSDADLEPVRAIVRDHIFETTAVSPGVAILGQTRNKAAVHSLQSARNSYGVSIRIIRGIAKHQGLLPEESENIGDAKLLIPAPELASAVAAWSKGITGLQAQELLGVSKNAWWVLQGAHFPPLFGGLGAATRYNALMITDFLDNLERLAVPQSRQAGMNPFFETMYSQQYGVLNALDLAHSGQLRIGWDRSRHGLNRLLVSEIELREALAQQRNQAKYRAKEVAHHLNLTQSATDRAIIRGLIPCSVGATTTGQMVRFVAGSDLKSLQRRFVSLGTLTGKGSSASKRVQMRQTLEKRGVLPLPDWLECSAMVFRRSEI
ncbi:TniQ family protein [Devosia sp. LC5]|uniref:TniQ family protein n=1 Tax=Devosia sp. LC5 TaxID=1502724 RepID=UPI0005507B1C|nr:TniQ family protein [Devosia sp. LC5]